MVDCGGVEELQERGVQGGELVPRQGEAHEGRGDAFGHGLQGVKVRAVIVGMPRRVKVIVRMRCGVSPAVSGGIVVRVGAVKDHGTVANNGESIDEAVIPPGALGVKGQNGGRLDADLRQGCLRPVCGGPVVPREALDGHNWYSPYK
jgi:hypothetical protein